MEPTKPGAADVLDRLVRATNAHDLNRLVDCFDNDYVLTDPAHPARSFTGAGQVRQNWRKLFAAISDIRLEAQHSTVTRDGFWLEARQVGTRVDGEPLDSQMVFIATVAAGRIARGRIYVCPVEQTGPGIDAVIDAVTGTGAP